MSLQQATVEQLVQWQAAIVDELARRAGVIVAPVARPPWEMGPPARAPKPIAQPMSEVDMLRARLAALEAGKIQPLAPPMGAPAMLAGQHGVVIPTVRTDPQALGVFQSTRPRPDGVPGVQGNGKGMGGQIGFSDG